MKYTIPIEPFPEIQPKTLYIRRRLDDKIANNLNFDF